MKYRLKNSPNGRVYTLLEASKGFVRFDDGSVYTEKDIIENFKAVEIDYYGYDDSSSDGIGSVWIEENLPSSLDRPKAETQQAKISNPVVVTNGKHVPMSTLEKARKFRAQQ